MAKLSTGAKVAEGLGLAALAAAAAAAYFLTGAKGRQNRKKMAAWTKQARRDMAKKLGLMKSLSKQAYTQASKEVLNKYRRAKSIKPAELAAFGKELKAHWDNIVREAGKLGKINKKAKSKAAR